MKKTSIYIEPDVDVALARRAAAEGTTKAEVIRRALRAAAQGSLRVKPNARGVFSGPPDLAPPPMLTSPSRASARRDRDRHVGHRRLHERR